MKPIAACGSAQGFGAAAFGQYAYFTAGSLGDGGSLASGQLLVFRLP